MRRLKILAVSPWDDACGIAEHTALAKAAIEAKDPRVRMTVWPEGLDPQNIPPSGTTDLIWLNYHAALHSQWTPALIERWRSVAPILVTYHDTGTPNTAQAKGICKAADGFIVHEPYDDLEGRGWYIRQGVPEPEDPVLFQLLASKEREKWQGKPVVGTVGFPFPWKNYDLLCQAAERAGWGVLLLAPTATEAQMAHWTTLNPATVVLPGFTPRDEVVSYLSGCDATAFLYLCMNGGTSGAIRQGMAARKPVLAFHPTLCRQFRDLADESAIRWLVNGRVEAVAKSLAETPVGRLDPGIVAVAHRERWSVKAEAYLEAIGAILEREY